MRRAYVPLITSVRGVRTKKKGYLTLSDTELLKRLNANSTLEAFGPIPDNNKKPASFIDDATTYSDNVTVLSDPHTSLPYKAEELEELKKKRTKKEEQKLKEIQKRRDIVRKGRINFGHIPVEEQVVVLFPGQGSQFVGMGAKLKDHRPSMELYERASEVLGYDLYDVCVNGPKTKLDQTIYCQPAVFVSSLAAFEKMKTVELRLMERLTDIAGFSIGEITALVVAGVMKFDDAIKLVKLRAEAMHECSQLAPSGMMTIRTTAASELDKALKRAQQEAEEAGENPICEIANYLFAGVKVIGGSDFCLNYLEEHATQYKIQPMKRLELYGAFHTTLMNDAKEKLLDFVLWRGRKKYTEFHVSFREPKYRVYSNYTGHDYTQFIGHSYNKENQQRWEEVRIELPYNIAKQVSNPVKWEMIQCELLRLAKKAQEKDRTLNIASSANSGYELESTEIKQRLPVSGAFHTKLMQDARTKLHDFLKSGEINLQSPRYNVFSNELGHLYHHRKTFDTRQSIIKQVTKPVKWEQIMLHLFRRRIVQEKREIFPQYIEVGPGKQLGALLRYCSKKMFERYKNYSC